MRIQLTATVESISQASQLLAAGVDCIYFGEEEFALRLPHYFSRAEQRELVNLAHQAGKKATIAVNGIMHPEKMAKIPAYLEFLSEIGVDQIVVGDTGVVHVIRREQLPLPFIYDGQTFVTSSRQVNFWGRKGAIGAVLAREVPYLELAAISQRVTIPVEILIYGATCIHQSKRPLLQNYFNFTGTVDTVDRERGLFISEPRKEETHYSIFEDGHGTHIFANNDLNLMLELEELYQIGLRDWKLDGIYTPGSNFVAIVAVFNQARFALESATWTGDLAKDYSRQIEALHPQERGLDTGFYKFDPDEVK